MLQRMQLGQQNPLDDYLGTMAIARELFLPPRSQVGMPPYQPVPIPPGVRPQLPSVQQQQAIRAQQATPPAPAAPAAPALPARPGRPNLNAGDYIALALLLHGAMRGSNRPKPIHEAAAAWLGGRAGGVQRRENRWAQDVEIAQAQAASEERTRAAMADESYNLGMIDVAQQNAASLEAQRLSGVEETQAKRSAFDEAARMIADQTSTPEQRIGAIIRAQGRAPAGTNVSDLLIGLPVGERYGAVTENVRAQGEATRARVPLLEAQTRYWEGRPEWEEAQIEIRRAAEVGRNARARLTAASKGGGRSLNPISALNAVAGISGRIASLEARKQSLDLAWQNAMSEARMSGARPEEMPPRPDTTSIVAEIENLREIQGMAGMVAQGAGAAAGMNINLGDLLGGGNEGAATGRMSMEQAGALVAQAGADPKITAAQVTGDLAQDGFNRKEVAYLMNNFFWGRSGRPAPRSHLTRRQRRGGQRGKPTTLSGPSLGAQLRG